MQKMAKEELLPHLEFFGLELGDNQALKFKGQYGKYLRYTYDSITEIEELVTLKALDIELIEEKPAITIKNLGLFMAKFGEYPKAEFTDHAGKSQIGQLVTITQSGSYMQYLGFAFFSQCTITDDKWTVENLKAEAGSDTFVDT